MNKNQVSAMDEKGDETLIGITDQFHLVRDQNYTKYRLKKRVNIMQNTERKGDTEGIGVKCECE